VDEALAALSPALRRVLDVLEARGGESTVNEVAAELGLHHNTARGSLDALVDAGLVVRSRQPARGRGRPAWAYASVAGAGVDERTRDYLALTTAFARHVARTSADPAAAARQIGREWGAATAATAEPPTAPGQHRAAGAVDPDRAARTQVVRMLTRGGFGPEPSADATRVALRRCPLLEAARSHPEVVCQVHQGMVEGMLTARGEDPTGVRLLPFAEPGACVLLLPDAVAGPA
jgi:predicted ArsR family transcriptional regulator